ncbi:hypothetical protein BBD46_17450 [Natrialba sp. SSL1]|nr:hypothetical protein BBD46_17450 [Natrialba sp. SSL1]
MTNVDQTPTETTALCMHPLLVINANDVAHAATFPLAGFRHGGRNCIRFPLRLLFRWLIGGTRLFGCRTRHRKTTPLSIYGGSDTVAKNA